ncbi:oligopeptide/dipeptide ABC transporter ATP-binding protein, partial [Pseudooceanicola nitratireducens]|uniref:oligopeptide/dipeptide ABC transporter ATP-binding protein n=1 Tax=Pseudooceanicola nitratireducens TaxID=517719 RepID=UPI003513857C
ARVAAMLEKVGLNADQAMERRPHEFSGGQCQRISIARALILEPDLLVCDEAVSALDVSVQAQVLNLLEDLKRDLGLTMLFISHDLAVVKHVSDRVAVMYLGRLCEIADAETLYRGSVHPYTRTLLSAVPEPDPEAPRHALSLIPGELPSPVNPPSGCPFRTRCPRASDLCASQMPQLRNISPGHLSACHHPLT